MRVLIDRLLSDLRAAWRSLRRAPAYAAVSVAMLATGLAATTALFAIVDGVLLRPLPVADEHRLVVGWKRTTNGFDHHPFTRTEIEDLGRDNATLAASAGIAFESPHVWTLATDGAVEEVSGSLVTGTYFDVIGARPQLGRALTAADDRDGAAPVLVLSHAFWQRRFAGRDVLGVVLSLDEQRFTIVGVMPPGAEYPHAIDVWRPLATVSPTAPFGVYRRRNVDLVARLAPGATPDAAGAELTTRLRHLEATASAGMPRGMTAVVRPYRDEVVGSASAPVTLLFSMTAVVLLIACANVAGLALVRGQGRRHEFAIRLSVGASPGRVMTPLLIEVALLTLVAATCGLALAWWSLPLLLALAPDRLPLADTVALSPRVLGFATLLAIVSASVGALGPSWSTARLDAVTALRHRGAIGAPGRRGLRMLVIAQAALALVVIVTAGALARSLVTLNRVDVGIAEDRLDLVRLAVPHDVAGSGPRLALLLDEITAALGRLPGVAAATPVNTAPYTSTGWDVPRYSGEGQSAEVAARNPPLALEAVAPGYFATLGIELRQGRPFTTADGAATEAVAIVSEAVAARTWPGQDPVGRRLRMGGDAGSEPWRTVVGVVRDVRYRDVRAPRPTLYLPAAQLVVAAQAVALRRSSDTLATDTQVRAAIAAVAPHVQVRQVASFDALRASPMARPRFQARVVTAFATAALLLAAAGLYAVTAAGVRQRRAEFGVRLALGASRAGVRTLVVREGLLLVAIGGGLGVVVAGLMAGRVSPLLFGVSLLDPAIVAGSVIVLLGAAIVACVRPAHQAAAVDPASTLRAD